MGGERNWVVPFGVTTLLLEHFHLPSLDSSVGTPDPLPVSVSMVPSTREGLYESKGDLSKGLDSGKGGPGMTGFIDTYRTDQGCHCSVSTRNRGYYPVTTSTTGVHPLGPLDSGRRTFSNYGCRDGPLRKPPVRGTFRPSPTLHRRRLSPYPTFVVVTENVPPSRPDLSEPLF